MAETLPAVIGAGGGGKGGGAPTSYAPKETPDSLRSTSYVDVIYLLGEGPIAGLVAGQRSIYVNDTPLIDADGQQNFAGGTMSWFRNGLPVQDPIPHQSVGADETPVGVEVTNDVPWNIRITDPTVDAVVVTLGFPQMAYQDTKTGEVTGTEVALQFFAQSNDGGYYAQPIGYGEVKGRRLFNQTIQADEVAVACQFTLRSLGFRYRRVKIYVGLGLDDRVLYMNNLELRAVNIQTEIDLDPNTEASEVTGEVVFPAGGLFVVWAEPADELGWDFRFESFQFFGFTSYVHNVKGKCLQRYQQQLRIQLAGAPPWDIRVVRLTGDSERTNLSNATWVDSYRTETQWRMSYPYSALCAVRYPAESFSSIPTAKFECRWLGTAIPANYNPNTLQYARMNPAYEWDGSWTWNWHHNPVWALHDLVTNARYGLGEFQIPVNKWELYTIAKYCDEWIPNGRGGWMPRFRCDLSLETQDEAYAWLQIMCACFRGMLFHIDGYLTATSDRPQDPEYLFTNANVVGGEFNYPGSSITARHTAVYVSWRDPELLDEVAVAYIPDRQLINRYGFNPARIDASWCRSEVYARQLGEWLLATEKYGGAVVFKPATSEAAFLRPGMIISVADENRTGERIGGRITGATAGSIDLDREVEIRAGVLYRLRVFNGLGEAVERTVTSATGVQQSITFTPDLEHPPAPNAVWQLEGVNALAPELYRIVEIPEEGGGISSISAVGYYPGIHDWIERDVPLPTRIVSSLRIQEALYIAGDGTLRNRVLISWLQAAGALRYRIAWRVGSGPWVSADSGDTLHEIADGAPGLYQVQVSAINALGKVSIAATAEQTVLGKTALPPRVNAFRIVSLPDGRRQAVFRYRPAVKPLDLRGFVIRYGRGVLAEADWSRMTPLHTGVLSSSPWRFDLAAMGTHTFAIKGVDTSGNESARPFMRTVDLAAPPVDGDILFLRSAADLGWPGQTEYFGQELEAVNVAETWGDPDTWDDMAAWVGPFDYNWDTPATWGEMPNWLGRPNTVRLTYTDSVIDLGQRLPCYALLDAETADTVTLQVRTSLDGVTWSEWRDPVEQIDARYVQVRADLTTAEEGVPPVLEDLTTVLVAKVIERVHVDLRTLDVHPSLRYGVGDVRVTTTTFRFIESVIVTVRLPVAAVSVVVVDKDPAGPRVRFFDVDGAPLDVTFDIRIRGY